MDGSIIFASWRQCAPRPNTCLHGPNRVQIPNGISIDSAVFAQLTAVSCYTLKWATISPHKIAPSHEGSGPHLIHGSLGTPESSTQMASRLVQPFYRAHYCGRPTDHSTRSVTIGRIYIRSTAMQPKKGRDSKVRTFSKFIYFLKILSHTSSASLL